MYPEVKEQKLARSNNHLRPLSESEPTGGPFKGKHFDVKVMSVTQHGDNIRVFEVTDPEGVPLPPFEPGSHIDVILPDESLGIRQYSLCGDNGDRSRYIFAVQREQQGRGGSKAIFDLVRSGSTLKISPPRNNFALHPKAKKHLLLAGGIGITPIMSMIKQLQREGWGFKLSYCTRSPESTAFLEELRPMAEIGLVSFYWDQGDPAKGLDIKAALSEHEDGTHLYYCGPPGFMKAVATASAHWPAGTTHREFFTPSTNDPSVAIPSNEPVNTGTWSDDADENLDMPFQVKIASTGQIFDVPSGTSILHVLHEHGFEIEASCVLGVCGTCRTRYIEGEVDHRDFVLDQSEQKNELTVCCSRSKSPLLILDI